MNLTSGLLTTPPRAGQSLLVTGGARSGKSRLAERLLADRSRVAYIATARAGDAEMAERIRRHRKRRNPGWATFEEPVSVAALLRAQKDAYDALLLDCITLWISNLMEASLEDGEILARAEELAGELRQPRGCIVCVTNEVGSGIVPAYPAGRRFRDLAGEANQVLAAACHRVVWMVAGLPVEVK